MSPPPACKHFERVGKQRMEALRLHRGQHIPNMVVARNLLHPKQRLAVRATMPVPVRQMPLMGQERRALHEKHRKRRHADIGHEVLDVFPAPSGRPAQVARSADIRSSTVPTWRLNQTRRHLQTARTHPDPICRPPSMSRSEPKMRIAGSVALDFTTWNIFDTVDCH